MEKTYYPINETAAEDAHNMNHMREYRKGEATADYEAKVDKCYFIGQQRIEKYPDESEKIAYLCDKFARKLADWYNTSFRIEAMCPSVLISGASNFPVHKKEKQNRRRDAHAEEWNRIMAIMERIESCGSSAIRSDDEKAIEKLTLKLEKLKDLHEIMKAVNAYYRKNHTLDGCPFLTDDEIEMAQTEMANEWHLEDKPFQAWELTNNSAQIRRVQERLNELIAVKSEDTKEYSEGETGVEGLKIVENTEAMRIQLMFDGKPSSEIRSILKSYGFKWAPSNGAWQRHLNTNGKNAAKQAVAEIKAL